ncbi:hypothetical protein LINGRAPRIM_LOCUS3458 [Linum grandiflorum]
MSTTLSPAGPPPTTTCSSTASTKASLSSMSKPIAPFPISSNTTTLIPSTFSSLTSPSTNNPLPPLFWSFRSPSSPAADSL